MIKSFFREIIAASFEFQLREAVGHAGYVICDSAV
jgi:hypothetical protein